MRRRNVQHGRKRPVQHEVRGLLVLVGVLVAIAAGLTIYGSPAL